MYCVITGASSGFGREYAYCFAALKYNLCIAARNISKLNELKNDLQSKYAVAVDVFPVDLSKIEDAKRLYDFTKDKKVDVLINNAGMSTGGFPSEVHVDTELQMLDLNVRAVQYLTRSFLSDMIKRDSGKILNMSSLSGWMPTPLISAYSAGKAYVLAFSEGISYELKEMKSNVSISVATPGFFNTAIAGSEYRMVEQHRSTEKYIRKVVELFLKRKRVIVLGRDKLVPLLCRILPRMVLRKSVFKTVSRTLRKI